MKVSELMTTDLVTIGPDEPLKEAARKMIDAGISGLIVVNESGGTAGVITEADFVRTESGRRTKKRPRALRWFSHDQEIPTTERYVGNAMTTELVTIGPDADHAEAARLMAKAGVKRLPVVDSDRRLVGVLSRSDILTAFARSDNEIIDEVNNYVMSKVLWIDPKRVQVSSRDGNVELTGRLETKSDADLLEELVDRVDGVVSVQTDLTWEVDNTKQSMVIPPPVGYW